MRQIAKIKEKPGLIKDLSNFAILNTVRSAIAQHKEKMASMKRTKDIESEINTLKSDVSEIKNMLNKVLRAVSNDK